MGNRIKRRILSFVLTLLIVSLFVFSSVSLALGDSSSFVLSDEASSIAVEDYRRTMGLDDNIFIRYLRFLGNFFTLNWGKTIGGEEIRKVILDRLPVTLSLSFYSILFSTFFSILIVFFSLQKRGMKESRIISILSSAFLVLPSFLTSLLLVLIFSLWLKLFPVSGYSRINNGFFMHFRSLFLPSLTLSLLHSSLMMRIMYSTLKESLEMPYTNTALSKGMKEKSLVVSSALKPSLPIFFTLISDSISSALGGSCVVENVFALPGMGSLMVKGALERDASLVSTCVMVVAFLVSFTFLVTDILTDTVDPRIRRSNEKA
ncbi:MAG: ABC transporter permease [Spirochaetales bacterium]|nr:ABC transporter permease [Spirochaetales bacterium]